jgi:hypothetical protein
LLQDADILSEHFRRNADVPLKLTQAEDILRKGLKSLPRGPSKIDKEMQAKGSLIHAQFIAADKGKWLRACEGFLEDMEKHAITLYRDRKTGEYIWPDELENTGPTHTDDDTRARTRHRWKIHALNRSRPRSPLCRTPRRKIMATDFTSVSTSR